MVSPAITAPTGASQVTPWYGGQSARTNGIAATGARSARTKSDTDSPCARALASSSTRSAMVTRNVTTASLAIGRSPGRLADTHRGQPLIHGVAAGGIRV